MKGDAVNKTMVVRYETRPETADENRRLIRAVFDQLAARRPDGLQYAVFQLADGVTFLHVVDLDGDDNPLVSLPAFGEFSHDIADRVVADPVASDASLVGSYRRD
jgi:hypothetical protein